MVTKFITDPMVTAILVVAAYGFAAALAWFRAKAARRVTATRTEWRMLATALTLLILALSFQLEFISEAIGMAKGVAKNQGWYAYRWPLATVGVLIFVAVVSLAFVRFRPHFRRQHSSVWLLGAGVAWLTGYFLLRATSIHWVDPWCGIHFGCPRTNPWIQVTGALVIAFGLWCAPPVLRR